MNYTILVLKKYLPFILIVLILPLLSACDSSQEPDSGTDENPEQMAEGFADTTDTPLQIKAGGETYLAVLPCSDCEGIQTRITFDPADQAYVRERIYLGRSDSVHTDIGVFSTTTGYAADESAIVYAIDPDPEDLPEAFYLRQSEEEIIKLTQKKEMPDSVELYTFKKEMKMSG